MDVLLKDTPEQVYPIKFDTIDADLVKKSAVRTRGGAESSGLDADGWRKILIAKHEVIKKLCTANNLSLLLEPFLAFRLIPLDKNPGLRPIGIGEILRWIAGKVVVSHVRKDLNFVSRFIAGLCRA